MKVLGMITVILISKQPLRLVKSRRLAMASEDKGWTHIYRCAICDHLAAYTEKGTYFCNNVECPTN